MPTPDRGANFEQALAGYDERGLKGVVDFAQHRFVSVERDPLTRECWVKGHRTLRGACDHLAGALKALDLAPERILDLDTGELHELDVFAHVAPKNVQAIALMLPREVAEAIASVLRAGPAAPHLLARATTLVQVALERSHDAQSHDQPRRDPSTS